MPNSFALERRARALRSGCPSLAVLPFNAVREEIIRPYFAEGVTSDIVDTLGRFVDLLVISSSSTLRFAGQHVDPRAAGARLGVRYVLTGSIDRLDQTVSFTQRLIDVECGEMLHECTVEANIDQLFELQHRIVARIVNDILPHIREAEIERAMRKPPNTLTAYDLLLQALPAIRGLDRCGLVRSRRLLAGAWNEDTAFAAPLAWAARMLSILVGQGWSSDRQRDAATAVRLAERAMRLDPGDSVALATAAHLNSYLLGRYDVALELFERALDACPGDALAWTLSSATLSYVGRTHEARAHALQALRLSPMDQSIHQMMFMVGLAAYAEGDFDTAATYARRSIAENPRYTAGHKVLATSLVGLGRIAEARDVANVLVRLEPSLLGPLPPQVAFRDPLLRQRFILQLRTAGALAPDTRA